MFTRLRTMMEERDQGFTLIELLVVIIIIGILAAIAIPVFLQQRQKGVDASLKADLKAAATAEETYITDNPSQAGYSFSTTPGGKVNVGNSTTFQASPGNTVTAQAVTGTGYCIWATNPGDSKKGASPMYYDSAAGGLAGYTKPTGGAC